jgi:MoaA/NifB/PqqE/SkfB family radical SAM enzyme
MPAAPNASRRAGSRFLTGGRKLWVYLLIAGHVALRYGLQPGRFHWRPWEYARFICRAARLLAVFRHGKVVRVFRGYKLQLYLPAYPSPAFFHALDSKLLRCPPGPVTVVYSMTKACTYRCLHCYQHRDGGPDLEEDLLLQTARDMRDSGVAMFDIEGGEPLVRFPRLLALLQALDERSEVWINTTGAGLTPEMLQQLKEAGLFGMMVSIHSPDAALHDALTRVPGSFDVACEALRLCHGAGLVAAANSVLAEDEVRTGGLARLMDLARDLGCDFVQLIHPKPAGSWLGRMEGMQRDEALVADLRCEHLRYNSAACLDYPALAAQVFEEAPGVLGCTSGAVDRFYVNATGEVQPCEFLNLSFGNVREEPFATILARMRAAFPTPCSDWLCCTQAGAIHRLYEEHGLTHTPLPPELTRELVATWDRGQPTALYAKLGIYR